MTGDFLFRCFELLYRAVNFRIVGEEILFHCCEKYNPGGRQYTCRTREMLDNKERKR